MEFYILESYILEFYIFCVLHVGILLILYISVCFADIISFYSCSKFDGLRYIYILFKCIFFFWDCLD